MIKSKTSMFDLDEINIDSSIYKGIDLIGEWLPKKCFSHYLLVPFRLIIVKKIQIFSTHYD